MAWRSKMKLVFLAVFSIKLALARKFDFSHYDVAFRIFQQKNVNDLLLASCSPSHEGHTLIKAISRLKYQSAFLDMKNESIAERQLTDFNRIGIILDVSCPESEFILKMASQKRLFNDRRFWAIKLNQHISRDELEVILQANKPALFDIQQYLSVENDKMVHGKQMALINAGLNEKLLSELKAENESMSPLQNVPEWLQPILNIGAYVHSEVILMVPYDQDRKYSLYGIHRKTNFTGMELEEFGSSDDNFGNLKNFSIPTGIRRKDFKMAVVRASCGLLFFDYFSRSEELTSSVVDQWAQISFGHMTLIEEMLNYRMLIKCFDDYGWITNGVFSGTVGFMQREQAEITATGLVIRHDRLDVLDFIDGTNVLEIGLLLRQPNLPAVANIFVLPFSSDVWLCMGAIIVVIMTLLWMQLRIGFWLGLEKNHFNISDIYMWLSSVISQQGTNMGNGMLALKISTLVVLFASIFFFVSYSAQIVALLQSPSSFINNLEDFSHSTLEIGIENLPYTQKLFQEDHHDTIINIFDKKVKPKGKDVFMSTREGVENVRKSLFAFQCELPKCYKLISETYEDHEKCGLKQLVMFPDRILGPAATKHSPYREILAQRIRWLREVGMTQRLVNRWSHKQPHCQSAQSNYFNIGLSDIKHLMLFFLYGLALSVFLFIAEFLFCKLLILRSDLLAKKRNKPKMFILVPNGRKFAWLD